MLRDIKELNFPSYATLSQATVTLNEMGDKTITSTLKIDGEIAPDFSYDWEVEFRGEKYVHPLRSPQASKENTSLSSSIELTFYHWAIYQLKRYYFVELTSIESGTAIADKFIASVSLNLRDFLDLLGKVLNYWCGDTISIDLNPNWEYDEESTTVEISYTYIWDLLQQIYELYDVRWEIVGNTIRFGYETEEISHVFKYGFEGGLMKVERQIQSDDIKNIILGRGGDTNLPYRYFKDVDPDNPSFAADPDWIPELANIYFSELRGKTFRDYIRGWKQRWYGGTDYEDKSEAYLAGYNDGYYDENGVLRGFNPIEYVKDDESIRKYGEFWGGLDNNEDIYPTIQGIEVEPYGRIDQAVDVEQITTDEIVDSEAEDSTTITLSTASSTKSTTVAQNGRATFVTAKTQAFVIGEGLTGTINAGTLYVNIRKNGNLLRTDTKGYVVESSKVNVYKATSDGGYEQVNAASLDEGTYCVEFEYVIQNTSTFDAIMTIDVAGSTVLVNSADPDKWTNVFDIWVKNIWQTTKLDSETDNEYVSRVWDEILGDRAGNEAKVIFASGWLSVSEDYEFTIMKVYYDTSKEYNGVKSEWRIRLAKSDADYDSLGVYIPSTQRQGNAGDYFFFTGIDLPNLYVIWAEERIDEWKKEDGLDEYADIKPTWNVTVDKVRVNKDEENGSKIIEAFGVGKSIRLTDERFIETEEDLFIQTLTYTYSDSLLPQVEITLSDEYAAVSNPVSTLEGEVDTLHKAVSAISNIDEAVAKVANKKYLRKDTADTSNGKITFNKGFQTKDNATFGEFASGMTGFGGRIDAKGNGELHSLSVRTVFDVPEIRYNRATAVVGISWLTSGAGIIESVTPDTDEDGNTLVTGTATLKLEDGEIGTIAVDDICMGIWHNIKGGNATEIADDSKGNFLFAGYSTVYFRVDDILDADCKTFRYSLRPVSDTWKSQHQPAESMKFACYGNFTNKDRQMSYYETTSYRRQLRDVNTWEFSAANIAMQFGDLSNLSVYGLDMTGYSAFMNNLYVSGTINQISATPLRLTLDTDGDQFLAYGESIHVTCTALRGWEDLTDQVTTWKVERDSGDAAADAVWGQRDKAKNFAGEIDICLSYDQTLNDLGENDNVNKVIFTFTAVIDTETLTTSLEI